MDIYKLAAIATIIVALIGVWQFIDPLRVRDTAINNVQKESVGDTAISNAPKKEKESVELSVDLPVYVNDKKWLFKMYQTALSMPYAQDKSDALKRVVEAAIESDDFNMAIIAAKESPYAASKAEMLDEVVKAVIKSKETVRYAVVAADNMPYRDSKSSALKRIVSTYETYAKQAAPHNEKTVGEPVNKAIDPTVKGNN